METTQTATTLPAASSQDPVDSRIISIDFVRGVAMILMAIDHVRVYSGVPAGGRTLGIFFTRWITHFVAPAFVFLAGTSIYLHRDKLESRTQLAKFLLLRGAWLVLLELTVIRICWTFNFDFRHYSLAGVIWMIGWCMILMAGLIYLPTSAIASIGIAIVAFHNLTDFFRPSLAKAFGEGGPNWFLKIVYFGSGAQVGTAPTLFILYVIVPWIGVMMTGYAFGYIMKMSPERRRAKVLWLGIVLIVLFVALRGLDVYGDPRPWRSSQLPRVLAFLSTNKYPASLLFLLMTLGPMLILVAISDGWRGQLVRIVSTFGRVPLFYYLLHIPLIHVAAGMVSLIREGQFNPWLFGNHPANAPPVPEGYAWNLGTLYAVFVICVIALYFPCAWFARLRANHRSGWLSYF